MPNIESANVFMRRAFDLFANIRPVKVPELNIDWMFFRENTEGEYALGSQGLNVTPELAVDFKVTTTQGSRRIIRAAFEYAKLHGKTRVTVVTKANVVKTTDGKFLSIAREIAQDYPDIVCDDWYIDIMTAKLIDPSRRSEFQVMVMPNLYGDILTDERPRSRVEWELPAVPMLVPNTPCLKQSTVLHREWLRKDVPYMLIQAA